MTLTPEAALDRACLKFCGQCRAALDPPGSQRPACGHLPPVTRPEMREKLAAEPGSIARLEAEALREEGAALLADAERKFRAADAVLHADALTRLRDFAQGVHETAISERQQAGTLLKAAEDAEARTRAPLADAFGNHRAAAAAEETARRMRHGANAETTALLRMNAAAAVLARYQEQARDAASARAAADAAVAVADGKVAAAEQARDQAAAAAGSPGAAELSRETVMALSRPVLRIAGGRDINNERLSRVDRAQAGVTGQAATILAELAETMREAEIESFVDQLRAEVDGRPVAARDTILPPGSRRLANGTWITRQVMPR